MARLKYIIAPLVLLLISYIAASNLLEPSPTTSAYDLMEGGPLQCSEFYGLLEQNYTTKLLLTSYSTLVSSAPDSVLVMMGPTEPFTEEEMSQLKSFVKNGGTLILMADNDGTGRNIDISQYSSNQLQISQAPLRDYGSYEKRPDFVLLTNFSNHPMAENVTSILTNYPSAVVESTPWSSYYRVNGEVAWTTSQSFLDSDRDGVKDENEPSGQFSVIATVSSGMGQIVYVADPGIFVNDMIDRASNRQFALSLFAWATEDGNRPIVLDVTHGGYVPPSWLGMTSYGGFFFTLLIPALILLSAPLIAAGVAMRRKKKKTRLGGELSMNIYRYSKRLKTSYRRNLNEPLIAYYEHFLDHSCSALKIKEQGERALLKRLKAEYPGYYRKLKRTIEVCGQARLGARDVRSPESTKRMINKMSEFEKVLEAKKQ